MPESKDQGLAGVRVCREDITLLEVDAFVYYAQHDLSLGTGFGNAIALRGGASIQEELEKHDPVQTCDVVVSDAGDLKATFILHAVGPRFQEPDLEEKLRRTMRNCLDTAKEKAVKSLAFPAMGFGFYGVPIDLCARVMLEEIGKHLGGETTLEEVVVCVLDNRDLKAFEARTKK